jgi:hypothetical protein
LPDYKLQIFKPYEKGDWRGRYRLIVIDPNNRTGYPANYVCVLPKKLYDKGKPLSLFVKKFGNKSLNYAVELINEAIKHEQNTQNKAELQKRLDILTSINSNENPKTTVKNTTQNSFLYRQA